MPGQARRQLLSSLKSEIRRVWGERFSRTVWDGRSIMDLARIYNSDDLPGDLCGALLIACTGKGFSVAKYRKYYRRAFIRSIASYHFG